MRMKKTAYIHGLITTHNKQIHTQHLSLENLEKEIT